MPKVKGLMNKVVKRTDGIGALFGFFAGFNYNLAELQNHIKSLTTSPRPPDFATVASSVWGGGVAPMIAPIVAGELMKYMGVYPKWGSALSKFGFGYIGGWAVNAVIRFSHNPGGIGGSQTDVSTAGRVAESIEGRASYPAPAVTTFGRAVN